MIKEEGKEDNEQRNTMREKREREGRQWRKEGKLYEKMGREGKEDGKGRKEGMSYPLFFYFPKFFLFLTS